MKNLAAFVGWDWGDREHVLRLREANSETVEKRTVSASAEAVHGWAAEMVERFGGKPVGVCVETTRGAVIWALMAYEHITLYPVNPKSLAAFRETFHPSGKKDDVVDADVALEMLYKHQEKMRAFQPADPATRELGMLSEHRLKLVRDMVRATNRLRANLKAYYPQALELAGELDTPMSCDFLSRWPDLSCVQRVKGETLAKFYRTHGSRSSELIDKRLAVAREAIPLTSDRAVLDSGVIVTRSLVCVIRALLEAVGEVDAHLAAVYSNHPEHALVDSFPGLGPVLGSRVTSLLGSDRSRFDSASELQRLTGVAPITVRTGGTNGSQSVYRRLKRSKFLHQTIVEWAGRSLTNSSWAQAFYDQQRQSGSGHWTALRALGYKWLRILFRCWKNETLYDELVYLAALQRAGSPLARLVKAA